MTGAALLADFLSAVAKIHATGAGTKETSFYTPLNNLLDAIGRCLKPRVRCVMQLKNQGAGNPDGGFFTSDQFDRKTNSPKQLYSPSRGVVEIKSPSEAISITSASKQVAKYWDKHKLVLVTNMRDWLLIGERHGERVELERFTLAATEAEFWALCLHPKDSSQTLGQPFTDFLLRVLSHNAPLSDPKELAWLLASYAREARHRITNAQPQAINQLSALRTSLESALGVQFDAAKGEHFFQSTLVQTLFYGLFAAWVLRHESGEAGPFDWKSAAHDLNVPMISALYGQLSQPSKLKALDLTAILDWAGDALNRVDAAQFFSKFESTKSVQYFYEPFLEAFDPELRKELGVWYTPEEIVRYQVARVDEVLRSELGLSDGLADPNVVVLDPCCGTGAYLVEILRLIGDRMREQGDDALLAHKVKEICRSRIFGFELLPAPFVVAHLQIGLLLRQLGVAMQDEQRAGIFLTNALTGWDQTSQVKQVLPFPEFSDERDAADAVKQTQKILVVIGNPPYNAYTGVANGEEQNLIGPYKDGLITKWGIKKFNLDEQYVRFFRLAERRIAEHGGRGVVSFISNYSWTTEPSFVVLRQHLLGNFDRFWIENLHGNRKISEYAPDGKTSQTVFAQKGFSPGIQQGVVISTWVKTGFSADQKAERVLYRNDLDQSRASERRKALLLSLEDPNRWNHYAVATPSPGNRYSFKPAEIGSQYRVWPTVIQLAGNPPINGLMEKRGGALIDINRASIASRMAAYFDPSVSAEAVRAMHKGLMSDAARFDAHKARKKALESVSAGVGARRFVFEQEKVQRYSLRPFDTRFCYYSDMRPLWNEPRPSLWYQHKKGNQFLVLRPAGVADPEGFPTSFTKCLGDNDYLRGHAYYLPFLWHEPEADQDQVTSQAGLFSSTGSSVALPNLSAKSISYLIELGFSNDEIHAQPDLLWLHVLAVCFSPLYCRVNSDGLRAGWPRIPLPASREALDRSANLGRAVRELLDLESPAAGVTAGSIRPELQRIAVVSRAGGGPLQQQDFLLSAGWGYFGKANVTMPGKGKVEPRAADPDDPFFEASLTPQRTFDVYLNESAFWKNVPESVWEFTIGGYQVLKKWLSYRDVAILGRPLNHDEVSEVTKIARRLASLVLLQPQLDESYSSAMGDSYAWVESPEMAS